MLKPRIERPSRLPASSGGLAGRSSQQYPDGRGAVAGHGGFASGRNENLVSQEQPRVVAPMPTKRYPALSTRASKVGCTTLMKAWPSRRCAMASACKGHVTSQPNPRSPSTLRQHTGQSNKLSGHNHPGAGRLPLQGNNSNGGVGAATDSDQHEGKRRMHILAPPTISSLSESPRSSDNINSLDLYRPWSARARRVAHAPGHQDQQGHEGLRTLRQSQPNRPGE